MSPHVRVHCAKRVIQQVDVGIGVHGPANNTGLSTDQATKSHEEMSDTRADARQRGRHHGLAASATLGSDWLGVRLYRA